MAALNNNHLRVVSRPDDEEAISRLIDGDPRGTDPEWRVRLLRWCLVLNRNTIHRALREVVELNRVGSNPDAKRLIGTAVSAYPSSPNIVTAATVNLIEDNDSDGAKRVLATAEGEARLNGKSAETVKFADMHRCVSEIMDILENELEDRLLASVEAVRGNLVLGDVTVSTCPVFPAGGVVDVVGQLARDSRLGHVIRWLNPGATVTARRVQDGPSREDAILVSFGSPGPGGNAWRRRMRVGWGAPLESWLCLAAGITNEGGFDINRLTNYIAARLKRVIGTYPEYCAFNSRGDDDQSVIRVADGLADLRSRQMYRGSFKLSPHENWAAYLSGLILSQHYVDYVPFSEVRSILDLGVFSGSELAILGAALPQDGAITCVDPFGSDKLSSFIASEVARDNRFDFVRAAIAGRSGTLSFKDQGGATAAVRDDGSATFTVPAVTLHQILDQRPELLTNLLIKTDVEGAEIDILDDLIAVSKQNRAILAVSIYHSAEQYTLIPEKLMDSLEGYHFHFNRYRPDPKEGVLYAIPDEYGEMDINNPYKRIWPDTAARTGSG